LGDGSAYNCRLCAEVRYDSPKKESMTINNIPINIQFSLNHGKQKKSYQTFSKCKVFGIPWLQDLNKQHFPPLMTDNLSQVGLVYWLYIEVVIQSGL